jgi:hypothetical protein
VKMFENTWFWVQNGENMRKTKSMGIDEHP